jgi:hypothetical protein
MYRRIHENLYSSISRYGNVFSSAQGKFLLIMSFMILTLFPLRAFSLDCNVGGDIAFSLENKTGEDICLRVGGPFFRTSGDVVVPGNTVGCNRFYAADSAGLPPWGLWVFEVDRNIGLCIRKGSVFKKFCLLKEGFTIGQSSVHIVVNGLFSRDDIVISGDTVRVPEDQDNPPCGWGAASYLGDQPRQRGRDDDDFVFNGIAGEEITITLEANQQSGNNGGIASLGLRGGSLNEFVEGVLPQEITATLPSDGKYSAIVMQPDIPRSERYEGGYYVSVESPTSNVGPLELGKNVER